MSLFETQSISRKNFVNGGEVTPEYKGLLYEMAKKLAYLVEYDLRIY